VLTAPPADILMPMAHSVQDETSLQWQVHLLRNQPARLPGILGAAILVFVGGVAFFHNVFLAFVPTLALILSLAEFLFPIHYTLNRDGARSRQGLWVIEMPWGDLQHVYLAADGVKLSPLRRRGSRMEPLRGVFLRFAGNDDAVVATIRHFRDEADHV
jgi:hypothetical protein